MLVLAFEAEKIIAVNVSEKLEEYNVDPLALVSKYGIQRFREFSESDTISVDVSLLELPPNMSNEQLGVGANYSEHGAEAKLEHPFLFPKYGYPTPNNSSIVTKQGDLLDYEVEICIRFSKDIRDDVSLSNVYKGIFLCGDFTNRAELMRRIDKTDWQSGLGYTDGKSGTGYFPVGYFLLVPNNVDEFLNDITMRLSVNGDLRQTGNAGQMIMKPSEILSLAFDKNYKGRWSYQGKEVPLLNQNTLYKEQTILTGTPEGVIFKPPSKMFIFRTLSKWVFTFGFFTSSPSDYVVNEYIRHLISQDGYLKAGDRVKLEANYLGEIILKIVSPDPSDN